MTLAKVTTVIPAADPPPHVRVTAPIEHITDLPDGSILAHVVVTSETPDSQADPRGRWAGEIVDYDAFKRAAPELMKWAVLSQMHDPNREDAGTILKLYLDDDAKRAEADIHVVDPDAVAKVKARVFKMVSIGGEVLADRLERVGNKIYRRLTEFVADELSLVPRGANPDAAIAKQFVLAKRHTQEEIMDSPLDTATSGGNTVTVIPLPDGELVIGEKGIEKHEMAKATLSLPDNMTIDQLREAIQHALSESGFAGSDNSWVRDVLPDKVIYSTDDWTESFSVDWSIDEAGTVTVSGTPVAVRNASEWVPRADALAKAAMSAADANDLPDSDFAYIEPGGEKDDAGKTTPRSLRHFPINDEAHVRNALARLSQSEFESEARPKVEAAARRFGIGEPAKGKKGKKMAKTDETQAATEEIGETVTTETAEQDESKELAKSDEEAAEPVDEPAEPETTMAKADTTPEPPGIEDRLAKVERKLAKAEKRLAKQSGLAGVARTLEKAGKRNSSADAGHMETIHGALQKMGYDKCMAKMDSADTAGTTGPAPSDSGAMSVSETMMAKEDTTEDAPLTFALRDVLTEFLPQLSEQAAIAVEARIGQRVAQTESELAKMAKRPTNGGPTRYGTFDGDGNWHPLEDRRSPDLAKADALSAAADALPADDPLRADIGRRVAVEQTKTILRGG
jgi:hypothetical protein